MHLFVFYGKSVQNEEKKKNQNKILLAFVLGLAASNLACLPGGNLFSNFGLVIT